MIRYALLLAFSFAFLFQTSQAQDTKRVLFVGNSYTYVNNLPLILSNLFLAGGDTLEWEQSTPGGATLEGHSTNTTTLSWIAQGTFDHVVLQGQSQRPSFPPGQVANEVYPYAKILCDSIYAANSCTEPIFYMTWGRKNGDQQNCQFYPPLCTYEGMQLRLRTSYLQMAVDNNCTVAPVGIGFWQSRLQDPNLDLYSADESHPSYPGSYLGACVFYATMLRESPVGLNYYGSLDSTTATFLQNVAELVVLDSMTQWRIGANDAVAAFNATANNDEVTFNDQSVNATSWAWDFGDGNVDSTASPVHTYATSGTYTVSLIVSNGCTSDTIMDTVAVTIVGIDDPQAGLFQISPNPSQGAVEVAADFKSAQNVVLEVWGMDGRLLNRYDWEVASGNNRLNLNLEDLTNGTYLIKMKTDEFEKTHRLLIHR